MLRTLEERRVYLDQSLEQLLADQQITGDYLRYYQVDAIKGIRSVTQRNRTRSYVQMPTSSGKTEVMLAVVEGLCRNIAPADIPRMFMVEPTQKLVRDTRARLQKHFPHIPVGVYYADEQDLTKPLTIITGDSFNDLLEAGVLQPEQIDYLFIDEAHRWLTKLRRHALKPFYETTIVAGFTATSRFNELKSLYRTLGEEAYSIEYAKLIKEGFIGERASVVVGMKLSEWADIKEQRRAYSHAVKNVILHYRDGMEDNEDITTDKIMIFEWEINDAKYTAELLNNDPTIRNKLIASSGNPNIIPAAVIHGKLSRTKLDGIIQDFDDGKIAYLVGSKIHIEGLDTKARHVITPERWSELEIEQVGGRVRDRSKLCRIFTICRENSGKRKPAFYSDSIGAVRITRQGADHGYARSLAHLELSHPPIDGLNIYNTPNEVASYIKSREVKPSNKATTYYSSSKMAEALVAWPLETAYIYKLLGAQHQSLPSSDVYCHIGGINIPRKFLMSHGDEILVREDAAEIIQDVIGNYAERPDEFISYNDIESNMLSDQANPSAQHRTEETKQLFNFVERNFSNAFLAWKYGTDTAAPHTLPLPATIRCNEKLISLPNIRVYLDGDKISVGVRESVLAQFWAEQITQAPLGADVPENKAVFGDDSYYQEIIERSKKQDLANVAHQSIYLTDPENWQTFVDLRAQKGDPGARRIFQALPASAKEPAENGSILFKVEGSINNVLYRAQHTLQSSKWSALLAALKSLPDRPSKRPLIDLKDLDVRKAFDALRLQKGNVIPAHIYRALPEQVKTPNEFGIILFNGPSVIYNVINGNQKKISKLQWDVLITTLEGLPDKDPPKIEPVVDLLEPAIRQKLDDLLLQKGELGAHRIYNYLPSSAKTPDQDGNIAWSSVASLDNVLYSYKHNRRRFQKTLRQSQWDVLIATLEQMPNRPSRVHLVDLEDPSNIQLLDDLLEKKGNPGGLSIYAELPLAAKTPDENGDVLIRGSNNIYHWLSGTQKKIYQAQWDVLIKTLTGMPDRPVEPLIDMHSEETRTQLEAMLERKGRPDAKRIVNAMPDSIKSPAKIGQTLFGANVEKKIFNILSCKKQILRQSQWDALISALEALSDEVVVDLTDPDNRRTLEELLQKKGRPGAKSIFMAMPAAAKAADQNGTILFPNVGYLVHIIYNNKKTISGSQWEMLKITLRKMPDKKNEKIVDLTVDKNRQLLNDALARKGNPTATEIFNALPESAKTPDENGMAIFTSKSTVKNPLFGRQKTIRQSQLDVLLATLEQMPAKARKQDLPKIQLKDDDFAEFERLSQQKGNPGAALIWSSLPQSVKTSDIHGEALFQSIEVIYRILYRRQKTIAMAQWDAIMTALGDMPDRAVASPAVDLTDPNIRDQITKLWNAKGKPSGGRIFARLPDTAKIANGDEPPLFATPGIIIGALFGTQKTMSQKRFDVMMAALRTTPGLGAVVDLGDESPAWLHLTQLWERKGKPGSIRIYLDLPAKYKSADENGVVVFSSGATIEVVLKHSQKSMKQQQFEALTEHLESLPDLELHTIDMQKDSEHRKAFNSLLKTKGNPGFIRIFSALPDEAKTKDANGNAIFAYPHSIKNILNGTQEFISPSQLQMLTAGLQALPDVLFDEPLIDVSQGSPYRDMFDKAWIQQGKPGSIRIFNAMPVEARQANRNSRAFIPNVQFIENILKGRKKAAYQAQLDTLIAAVKSIAEPIVRKASGSIIDLSEGSANWKKLSELLTRKGSPGSTKVFDALPLSAKQPNDQGTIAFRSADAVAKFMYGDSTSVQENDFQFILAALEALPETGPKVDLSATTAERITLNSLWAKKGYPAAGYIFSVSPTAQRTDDTGKPIIGNAATYDKILNGAQTSSRQNQFDFLISALQAMPDSNTKVMRSKQRRAAKDLLERRSDKNGPLRPDDKNVEVCPKQEEPH